MMEAKILEFIQSRPVAVVGASADRAKYGNIVLRNLRDRGWTVYAINPRAETIEGEPAYPNLAACPQTPGLAVMVTPPEVTRQVLDEAAAAGVGRIWMQPGAGDAAAIARANELGLELIHDACIMVAAARHDR
ncbi:MAG TPA: CoA-binding protein [Candidatus Sumerlaeota bacterium]|nr:CoA-binding protein [Candidatus Sumerlaeota bacterium]HPK01263.1 CoA-binding protein [Candidatus Sumerlaeota bacterium]